MSTSLINIDILQKGEFYVCSQSDNDFQKQRQNPISELNRV